MYKITLMKYLLCLSFMLFVVCSCLCQTLEGKIKNEVGADVPDAEILLAASHKNAQFTSFSDSEGVFKLYLQDSGYYNLKIFYYGSLMKDTTFLITQDIKSIFLIKDQMNLSSVTVSARKKVIERKVDRLVYNVENSIASTGLDLSQLLATTPLIRVTEDGVSIIGKNAVGVMINGKILNISGIDLINYLKSLRSEDISKIEVITTPPSKYEAQGNSGLINIQIKKNPRLGFSGNIGASSNKATYYGYSANSTLNYQTEKTNSSLRLRGFDRNLEASENINITGPTSIFSKDLRKDNYTGLGANLLMDFTLHKLVNFGFVYDLGDINNNMDIDNNTTYFTNSFQDSILSTTSKHRNPFVNNTLNVYMDYRIDSIGTKLSLNLNYFLNAPKTTVNFNTISDKLAYERSIQNTSFIDYNIRSYQADLYMPKPFMEIEIGAKYTNFENTSDVGYFNYVLNQYIKDNSRSNLFNYNEENYAAYASFTKNLNPKWTIQSGLRYEYTNALGFSPSEGTKNSFSYGRLFPTVYLNYKPNENNILSINYSKRINRPGFRALNPFRWYTNPLSYYTGNPLLQPSYNHNVELAYVLNNAHSFTLYWQRTIDGFGRIVEVKSNNEKVVNYGNFLRQNDFGINMSFYFELKKWWETSLDISSFYSSSSSVLPNILPQKGFSLSYSNNNTFTISQSKNIYWVANFWHSLPSFQGNSYANNLSSFSTGLRLSFLQQKLRVNFLIEDLFKGSISKGQIYFSSFTQNYNNYYDNRRGTLSISYAFGNKNVRGNNKQVRFDEKNRTN